MAWNSNDNPWSGGGNPWGGGKPPPDLKSFFTQQQDKFKQFIPKDKNNWRWIVLIALLLVGGWLLTGFYRVEPDERGVALVFGEWVATTEPGLRYNVPWPIGETLTPKVTRVNRIDIGYQSFTDGARTVQRDIPDESLMLTGDENIINIDFTVFWVIKDPGEYLFKIREPESTVKKAAESAMREVIGRTELQPALTEARQQIEGLTLSLLQTMLDQYQSGIEITQVQLQQSDPPEPVIDAFNDVQRARADRERLRNEADAYRNDIIPRARGDAERVIQEAQAYREEVINLAYGDASRFLAILESYQINKEVTARRMYLETMEEVFNNADKIIIETGEDNNQGVLPYLPLDRLRGSPPQ